MWARVARFEGDPGNVDAAIDEARGFAASGNVPASSPTRATQLGSR
jgi:hypothetical protein